MSGWGARPLAICCRDCLGHCRIFSFCRRLRGQPATTVSLGISHRRLNLSVLQVAPTSIYTPHYPRALGYASATMQREPQLPQVQRQGRRALRRRQHRERRRQQNIVSVLFVIRVGAADHTVQLSLPATEDSPPRSSRSSAIPALSKS